ncbi:hypothetical protein C8Q80DRAFT_1328571 [Daedaleopsis nitida]|nr:hypothetical protein C8Q80DRAFT_1328571 [Daedaleopsis nitida]
MFSAFSLMGTPFDLQATLDSWATSAPEHSVPQFNGKPKRKDEPAPGAWLDLVEQGCSARRVPKTHWPAVAKHFMAKKARGRVCEVEKVMMALHGEQWTWSWKNFRVAVLNMGWNIDDKKTREINVERKASGLWKIVTGQRDDSPAPSPVPKNGGGSKLSATAPPPGKKVLADAQPNKLSKLPGSAPKPAVLPSKSSDNKNKDLKNKDLKSKEREKERKEKESKEKEKESKNNSSRPSPPRSSSLFTLPALPFLRAPAPQPEQSMLTKISAQVPLWLLAATDALATLANENPDVLTAIVTGLVAVGTLSTGGSAAVAAVGEAAVVVGRALKTAHERVHSGHRGRGR